MCSEICESRVLLSATQLTGTAGNDVFTLTYDGSASGNVDVSISTNGRASTSIGTFSMASGLAIDGLGGTDTVKAVGTTGADVYVVSGGSLTINRSQLSLMRVENRTLAGLSGSDTYRFATDTQLGKLTIDDSGGSRDLLDFSPTTTAAVKVNLNTASSQTINRNLRLSLSAGNSIEDALGGAGNDVLLGNALDNRFQGGAGNDYMNGFAGSDILVGGDGNDTYAFTTATSPEADSIIESAAVTGGRDEIRFNAVTTSVIVNLSSTATQSVHKNRTLHLNSGTAFETIYGGSANDILTGNSLANVLVGGGGSDQLRGVSGDDTYIFEATTTAETDTVFEATGGGVDLLTFASVTANVHANLSIATNQVVQPNRVLRLSAGNVIENLTGGRGNDTLLGNGLNNLLRGGAGNDVLWGRAGSDGLIGGTGDDIYNFENAAAAELDSIYELTGQGSDTVQFTNISADVTINLTVSGTQDVHTNRRLNIGTNASLENINGGLGDDRLTGNAAANILIGGAGSDVLIGLAGNDTYAMANAATLETDTIIENENQGLDTISFGTVTVNINLSLATTAFQTVHTNRRLRLSNSTALENVVGGSGNDRLIGNAANNRLLGNDGQDTLIGARGSDLLKGGSGNDTYILMAAFVNETDTIGESANGGIDIINFSSLTVNVAVNLGTTQTQTVHTHRNLRLLSSVDIENVTTGSGSDTLTGNMANNWLNAGAGSDSMLGRGGDDVYYFGTASSTELDRVTELDGEGTDTLSFSGITANLTLNLGITATQNIHTSRQLILNSGTGLENVISGAGNDTLTGNSLSNVLVGNAGDDSLFGLQGRDILIGGPGADVLLGGSDEDILIAGRTTSDLRVGNLLSLQTEWVSGTAINTRIDHLRAGTGSPQVSLKARVNVLNDSGADDQLAGGADLDWYFRAIDDVITDLASGEQIDVL
jgi:Ca2+-binding RTX toxin-like protein